MPMDEPVDGPKVSPTDRIARTELAFREIVSREKTMEVAKTARLRKARIQRDAQEAKTAKKL